MESMGSIKDFKIRIKPSIKLIDFISGLEENVLPLGIYEIKKSLHPHLSEQLKLLENVQESSATKLSTDDMTLIDNLNKNLPDVQNDLKNLSIFVNSDEQKNDEGNKINSLLNLDDLKWLYTTLLSKPLEDKVYLHELLVGSVLILPDNEVIERNPELEARCVKLRARQQAWEYKEMTRNVDNKRKHEPQETISYQINQINRQLIAVLQFIVSVLAGFLFGFLGLELMIGPLDFGFRLLMGVMCSLIIAIAEIYFLAKKLSEEDEIITNASLTHMKPIEVNNASGADEKKTKVD